MCKGAVDTPCLSIVCMFAWESNQVAGTHLSRKSQFVLPRFVRICFQTRFEIIGNRRGTSPKRDIFHVHCLSALTLFAANIVVKSSVQSVIFSNISVMFTERVPIHGDTYWSQACPMSFCDTTGETHIVSTDKRSVKQNKTLTDKF